jgi:phospholipid/cholesterol/gamma-HCH transport system substrate-binding protein
VTREIDDRQRHTPPPASHGRAATLAMKSPVKSDDIKEIAVGLAAVVAFVAVAALMQFRSDVFGARSDDSYTITATFNRVDGVAPGTPVRVGGIFVGRVEHLVLTPDYRVRVTMSINRSIALPADSSISIQTDGLFGPKTVRIEPGGEDETVADGGHLDYSQDPLMVSELLDLIIAEGRAARAAPAAAPAATPPAGKTEAR